MYTIPEISTAITALLPITELRGAIPLGIALGLTPIKAFLIATCANLLIAPVLLKILDSMVKFLFKHIPFLHKKVEKYFNKLHHRHNQRFNKWGAVFLLVFVSIPLPGSGAWSGSALAYLFNIPYKLALTVISLGVIIAGIAILLLAGFFVFAI